MGKKLHPYYDYLQAEVIWAIRNEMARTVEDVLARRLRLLFLDAKAAKKASFLTSRLMAGELVKDAEWQEQQILSFNTLADNYILQP